MVYNENVEKGNKAFLVLGLPASGKSSVITNSLLIENKISMHLFEIKAKTSMSRMLKKFITKKLKGKVDKYVKWTNEVKRGDKPICIDKGNSRENGRRLGAGGSNGNGIIEGISQPGKKNGKNKMKYPWDISLAEEINNIKNDNGIEEYALQTLKQINR